MNKYLVAGAKAYELFFGRLAGDSHLCVSKAMASDLKMKLRLKELPTVVYDLATKKFKQLNINEKHDLLKRYGLRDEADPPSQTILTEFDD